MHPLCRYWSYSSAERVLTLPPLPFNHVRCEAVSALPPEGEFCFILFKFPAFAAAASSKDSLVVARRRSDTVHRRFLSLSSQSGFFVIRFSISLTILTYLCICIGTWLCSPIPYIHGKFEGRWSVQEGKDQVF